MLISFVGLEQNKNKNIFAVDVVGRNEKNDDFLEGPPPEGNKIH